MGHDMFISRVLKIPSEARFPVWKMPLSFQKQVQGFSPLRLPFQNNTKNDLTILGTWRRNTQCAKQVFSLTSAPRCKPETEEVISQLKLELPKHAISVPTNLSLFYIVQRETEIESCYTDIIRGHICYPENM